MADLCAPIRATIVGLLGAALVAAVVLPTLAAADGDPASDVLLGENVFYPFTPHVSAGLQHTLNGQTAATVRAHFPLKVALIASRVDLGAIPELFDKPQQYASFLDQEITFQGSRQPLLVVMPDGYGVSGLDRSAAAAAASLQAPKGGAVDELAQAAILAVPKLAAASGHPIAAAASTASGTGGSTSLVPIIVLGAVAITSAAAILALRSRRGRA